MVLVGASVGLASGVAVATVAGPRALLELVTGRPSGSRLAAQDGAPRSQQSVRRPPRHARPESDSVRIEAQQHVRVTIADGRAVKLVLGPEEQRLVGPRVVELSVAPDAQAGWAVRNVPRTQNGDEPIPQESASADAAATMPPFQKETASSRLGQTATPQGPGRATPGWARAAEALREKNPVLAERALTELAESSDPRTRDAARLARAQLWISSGLTETAHPVLVQLARSGATSLIRQRAQRLLDSSAPLEQQAGRQP